MLRRLLLATILTAASVPAFAQCDTRFTLVNRSGSTVSEFYFGPSTDSNWGRDRLGTSVLENGRQMRFDTQRAGNQDFKVVWATGETAELMRVDICVTSEIVATPRGIEAR